MHNELKPLREKKSDNAGNGIIKFPVTITGIAECLTRLMFSFIPVGLILPINIHSFGHLLAISITVVIAYSGLEKIFPKRFVIKDGGITFYNGIFRYYLAYNEMIVYYEKVFQRSGNSHHNFALVFYREKSKIGRFTFTNRFVLTYELNDLRLEELQKEFKDKMGIEIIVFPSVF